VRARLRLALSLSWLTLFMGDVFLFFPFLKSFCFSFALFLPFACHAAMDCLAAVSTFTPMAQMKPSSSRPTAVTILR